MAMEPRATRSGTSGDVGNTALWAMVGLNVAWITGLTGSFVDEGGDTQNLLWSLAALGGSMGSAAMMALHLRAGRDLAAAGFALAAVLNIATQVAGFSGPGADSVFVQLSILQLGALWLIAYQDWSAMWTRATAAISGLFFAIWGYKHTLGDAAPDIDSPLLTVAYIALTLSVIGWTMTLRSES